MLVGLSTQLGSLESTPSEEEESPPDTTPDEIEVADLNSLSLSGKIFAYSDPLLWHYFVDRYGVTGISLLEEAFRRLWVVEGTSFYWGTHDFDYTERKILFQIEDDPYDTAENLYTALQAGLLGKDSPVQSPPYDGEVRYRDLAKTWRNETLSRALERAEATIEEFLGDVRNDLAIELTTGGVGSTLWFIIRRGDDVVDAVEFVDNGYDWYSMSKRSVQAMRQQGINVDALERGFRFRNFFNGGKQTLISFARRGQAAADWHAEVKVLNTLAKRGDELLTIGDEATRRLLSNKLLGATTKELIAAKKLYSTTRTSGGLAADFIGAVGRNFHVAEVKNLEKLAGRAATALRAGTNIKPSEWRDVQHAIDQVIVTATALKKASKSVKFSNLEVYLPKEVVAYMKARNLINAAGSIPQNSEMLGVAAESSSELLRLDGVLIFIKQID